MPRMYFRQELCLSNWLALVMMGRILEVADAFQ